jgi:hypothetical protein
VDRERATVTVRPGRAPIARAIASVAAVTAFLLVADQAAAREAGDVILVNNVGVPLYTHNFDTGKDVGVGEKLYVAEFIGAHYFVTRTVRVGMTFLWAEQYTGVLAPGADRFTMFALLPQVGWSFYDHFSAAAVFCWAPRAAGKDQYDLGVQAAVAYGLALAKNATLNLLLNVSYNFHVARTLGITPLTGLTLDL